MTDDETKLLNTVKDVRSQLRSMKPGDRSNRDRHIAICITWVEIVIALILGFIINEEFINE